DTPLETYQRPVNRFVAGFIGMPPMNFFHGMIKDEGGRLVFEEGALKNARRAGGDEDGDGTPGESTDGPILLVGELAMPGAGFRLALPPGLAARVAEHAGRHVVLGIRPEHFELNGHGGGGSLEAMMNVVEPLGSDMDVYLSTRHHPHVVARVSATTGLKVGEMA